MEKFRSLVYQREDTKTEGRLRLTIRHKLDGDIDFNLDPIFQPLARKFIEAVDTLHGINDTKPSRLTIRPWDTVVFESGDFVFAAEWKLENAPRGCQNFVKGHMEQMLREALDNQFVSFATTVTKRATLY